MLDQLRSNLQRVLLERAQSGGGWPYSAGRRQIATEPTALAILATGVPSTPLTATQSRDGSWRPIHLNGLRHWPASWSTSLALIALLQTQQDSTAIRKAVQWLTASRGKESHWLWRWKFKTVDTQVRFEPDRFGWSWAPNTASWVIPTAFAVLALRMAAKQRVRADACQERIQLGIEMLLDRACVGGGWNAGNSVAFGVALAPLIEATSIALLALQRTTASGTRLVRDSLGWLIEQTRQCNGIASTVWAVLALQIYGADSNVINARLTHLAKLIAVPNQVTDNCALALSALALDAAEQRNVFGVTA